MTTEVIIGALLGALAATGLLLAALSSPPFRRPTLTDRVAPYLADADVPSRLLANAARADGLLRRLLRPLLDDGVRVLDRMIGGQQSVRRRLGALDSSMTVDQFRTEQVVWGACGAVVGIGVCGIATAAGRVNLLLFVVIILGSIVTGVLARDWWLSRAVARRDDEILTEFPLIAEMLALAVTAGEGPIGAIERITALARGQLVSSLAGILAHTRAGMPVLEAITDLRDRTALEPLSRFLDGMAVAIERGTPLADVLQAQAADVRAMGKRRLMETGGRKEIAMMAPVVFLIMPTTIIFALYPGLVAITAVAH